MELRQTQVQTKGVNDENREVEFTASTSDRDRHKTVVNQNGWRLENFNANGIIGYQHNVYGMGMCEKATPDDVIGNGQARVENGELIVKIKFKPEGRSELADKVFEDVRDGFLKTVSVGFIEVGKGKYGRINEKGEEVDTDVYFFEGQELLEISIVNIPSNPKALKKQFRESTAFALTYLVKAFDNKYRFSEIEEMKVKDILNLLEGKGNNATDTKNNDVQPDEGQNARKSKAKYNKYQIKKFEIEKQQIEI